MRGAHCQEYTALSLVTMKWVRVMHVSFGSICMYLIEACYEKIKENEATGELDLDRRADSVAEDDEVLLHCPSGHVFVDFCHQRAELSLSANVE